MVVTRRDLSAGQQAVQSVHAAVQFCFEHPESAGQWFEISKYLALMSVEDEKEIEKLEDKCIQLGIDYSLVKEPDIGYAVTAICLEPSERARKLLGHLPLTLKNNSHEK